MRTKRKKAQFLAEFRTCGNVSGAARAVGVDRGTHYGWLESDETYVKAFAEAEIEAVDVLETEARRRAFTGVDEPVFYKGDVCGQIKKYSDVLLIFLLKGARPEKYRERFEHSGRVDGERGDTVVFYLPTNGREDTAPG